MIEKKYSPAPKAQQEAWLAIFEKKQKTLWCWIASIFLTFISMSASVSLFNSSEYEVYFFPFAVLSMGGSICYSLIAYRCPQCDTLPMMDDKIIVMPGSIQSGKMMINMKPKTCKKCGLFLSSKAYKHHLEHPEPEVAESDGFCGPPTLESLNKEKHAKWFWRIGQVIAVIAIVFNGVNPILFVGAYLSLMLSNEPKEQKNLWFWRSLQVLAVFGIFVFKINEYWVILGLLFIQYSNEWHQKYLKKREDKNDSR